MFSLMVKDVQPTLPHFQHWLSICCSEDSLLCEHRDKRAIGLINSQWIVRTAHVHFWPNHSFSWWWWWWMSENKAVGNTFSVEFIISCPKGAQPWHNPYSKAMKASLSRPISFSTCESYISIDSYAGLPYWEIAMYRCIALLKCNNPLDC